MRLGSPARQLRWGRGGLALIGTLSLVALSLAAPGALRAQVASTARPSAHVRGATLTLSDALRGAAEGSRDLLLASTQLRLAEVDIARGWSAIKPKASVQGVLTRNDKEISFTVPKEDLSGLEKRIVQSLWQQGASATIAQPLFNGQAIPGILSLYDQRDATVQQHAQLRQELLYGVARAFYSVLALQESAAVAQAQVETTQAHLEVATLRLEAKRVPQVAVTQARLDVAMAESDLAAAETALAQAKHSLAGLIGRPHDAGEFTLQRPPPPTDPLEGISDPAALLAQRGDLRARELQIVAADRMVQAAWMRFVPNLDMVFSARWSEVSGFLRSDNLTWLVNFTFSWPLYDGGLRYAEIEAARLRRRQAQLELEAQRDRVTQELRAAQLELEAAATRQLRAEQVASLARENLAQVQARIDAEVATPLDLTDATQRRFGAEVEVSRRRLELELATLALAKALGLFEEVATKLDAAPLGPSAQPD